MLLVLCTVAIQRWNFFNKGEKEKKKKEKKGENGKQWRHIFSEKKGGKQEKWRNKKEHQEKKRGDKLNKMEK